MAVLAAGLVLNATTLSLLLTLAPQGLVAREENSSAVNMARAAGEPPHAHTPRELQASLPCVNPLPLSAPRCAGATSQAKHSSAHAVQHDACYHLPREGERARGGSWTTGSPHEAPGARNDVARGALEPMLVTRALLLCGMLRTEAFDVSHFVNTIEAPSLSPSSPLPPQPRPPPQLKSPVIPTRMSIATHKTDPVLNSASIDVAAAHANVSIHRAHHVALAGVCAVIFQRIALNPFPMAQADTSALVAPPEPCPSQQLTPSPPSISPSSPLPRTASAPPPLPSSLPPWPSPRLTLPSPEVDPAASKTSQRKGQSPEAKLRPDGDRAVQLVAICFMLWLCAVLLLLLHALIGERSSKCVKHVYTSVSSAYGLRFKARASVMLILMAIPAVSAQSVGMVTTIAGSRWSQGFSDGIGTNAAFSNPMDMTVTPDGSTMYVTDYANNRIRKIDLSTQVVTTFLGNASNGYADGIGTNAVFNYPMTVVMSADASKLYISDTNGHRIRQADIASRVVTTLVGSGELGTADGVGTAASIQSPQGLAIDSTSSYLYVAQSGPNRIRQIEISSCTITTLALGSNGVSSIGSGSAPGTTHPAGVAISPDDTTLFIGEYAAATIARIDIASARSASSPPNAVRIAGALNSHSYRDGVGGSSRFYNPKGLAVSADGCVRANHDQRQESSQAIECFSYRALAV